jgi:hypothetical protein
MITNVATLQNWQKIKKIKIKITWVSHLIVAAIYKYEVSTFIIPGSVGWATTHWVYPLIMGNHC